MMKSIFGPDTDTQTEPHPASPNDPFPDSWVSVVMEMRTCARVRQLPVKDVIWSTAPVGTEYLSCSLEMPMFQYKDVDVVRVYRDKVVLRGDALIELSSLRFKAPVYVCGAKYMYPLQCTMFTLQPLMARFKFTTWFPLSLDMDYSQYKSGWQEYVMKVPSTLTAMYRSRGHPTDVAMDVSYIRRMYPGTAGEDVRDEHGVVVLKSGMVDASTDTRGA